MDKFEKYLVEQTMSLYENEKLNGLYRKRLMFENEYGVLILEDIMDNEQTWNVFAIQEDIYDPEQGIDYIFRYDIAEMRNVTFEKVIEVIEKVKSIVKEEQQNEN